MGKRSRSVVDTSFDAAETAEDDTVARESQTESGELGGRPSREASSGMAIQRSTTAGTGSHDASDRQYQPGPAGDQLGERYGLNLRPGTTTRLQRLKDTTVATAPERGRTMLVVHTCRIQVRD